VRIPRRIVIPWLLEARLAAGEPAILAEGEFDTMLLWQHAGDLACIATLGSCNRGISARALRYLLGCPRLLVAYDVDAEGEKGAERLAQLSPRMHRIRPPVGKDVTAFWQAGGRVRDWVRFELARL
jgi:DNA primase